MYEVHNVDIVIVNGCKEAEPSYDGGGDASGLSEDLLSGINLASVLYPVIVHKEVEAEH